MNERAEVWIDDELAGEVPARVSELSASGVRGRQVTRFRYDTRWLERGAGGFAIDPELPLGEDDFFPVSGRTLHGVLRDASPDRWGRRLMDRREVDDIDETDHRRSPENLPATAELYRPSPAAAARIEDELRARLAGWRGMAVGIGIPGNEIDLLDAVILPAEL